MNNNQKPTSASKGGIGSQGMNLHSNNYSNNAQSMAQYSQQERESNMRNTNGLNNNNTHKNYLENSSQKNNSSSTGQTLNPASSHQSQYPSTRDPIGMRPTSGGGALSNAGQMMMQSSNKKLSANQQMRNSQNNFAVFQTGTQGQQNGPTSNNQQTPNGQFYMPQFAPGSNMGSDQRQFIGQNPQQQFQNNTNQSPQELQPSMMNQVPNPGNNRGSSNGQMQNQQPSSQNQIRSQSQDKSKIGFKARLDQKAAQLSQDDSSIPNHAFNLGQQNKQTSSKNQQKQNKNGAKGGAPTKLPRTGIDQPFLKERPRFKENCREFEQIHQFNSQMCDEFARLEVEKQMNNQVVHEKIVYDCMDYPATKNREGDATPYIDESDIIELPPDENPVDHRKYYPYGPSGNGSTFNQKVPKLNRYYQKLKTYCQKENEEDKTLIFESRFESGNLRRAVKVGENEYNLILKYDHNTTTYTQWFYFRMQNVKKFTTYKFNIVNLVKPESSYNQGMKPLFYSKKEAEQNEGTGNGWYRDGTNICYFPNTLKKKGGGFYYTLTFQVQFMHDDDEVYAAHCYPYTYSDCSELLVRLCQPEKKDRIRKTIVCKTIAGNDCEMAIITNFSSRPEEIAIRRAIVITSRVHPGESNASFIVEGILEFLVSEDEVAKYLRNNFVFKIIPMLNPDGVIVGNYRCSLSGLDLNRQWIAPSMKQCPENCSTKMMMRKTLESRDILFYCDIHGHSRCKNLFMYGCSNQRADRLKERIFPLLFHKNTDFFFFDYCSFVIQKQKESTGRVVMWKEFQLINSFTLESSFCGPTRGLYKDCHFTIPIYKEMGKLFCITLRDYASNEQKVREAIQELEVMFPPPKAEEGLSSQFQQIDRNNGGFGGNFNNNGYLDDGGDDKKASKNKKKGITKATNATSNTKEGGKQGKGTVFEVPSTSSKQSRAQNNDDGKKKKTQAPNKKK